MADHIPFITGPEGSNLAKTVYSDSDIVRTPLYPAQERDRFLPATAKVWLDPCVDRMHDLQTRRSTKEDKSNPWFKFMTGFPNFEKIGTPPYHAKKEEVYAFVKAVMDKCAERGPAWITVPQLPLVGNSDRNKINRALAAATGTWKSSQRFSGSLILPLIFTNQAQMNLKTARNRKVQQAQKCYQEARADGFWVVDASLNDESGSATLRNKRFPGVIALHEELNDRISSKIRIAGPYWGLNLVLWSRGLVDYPAIGIGSGYQFLLAGGPAKQPSIRLMLASLRRRVGVGTLLEDWLKKATATLAPSHPAHAEFTNIRKQFAAFRDSTLARKQVATNYKQWFDNIAAVPEAGRSLALFQDLSAAFVLGRSLPSLGADEGTARRPEAVAMPLMLSCL